MCAFVSLGSVHTDWVFLLGWGLIPLYITVSVFRRNPLPLLSEYRGADKSLARLTSRCILFDDENISFDASLVIYRVSQEECARLREGVPYVKVYRYNPKHLCPKLNRYGDNGQRKVWSSGRSTHWTCQLTTLCMPVLECGFILRQFSSCSQ